ncbi:MAG: hypothetical protein Q8Q37_00305 [bacterium]|nr:hypothetical protein [bacterium]
MTLRKKGFLFRYAYPWAWVFVAKAPARINLCRFFWRCVILAPLQWMLAPIILVFIGTCCALGFLFGYRPNTGGKVSSSEPLVAIQKLPHLFGMRILPIYLILPGMLMFGIFTSPTFSEIALDFLLFVCVIAGVVVTIIIISTIVGWLWNLEVRRTIRAWVAAKKEKICPIIEIVDDEATQTTTD